MYTEDIYSRLLAGEDADAIAAEMAKAMNDAIAKVEEEKARKAEEEAKVLAEKEAKAAKREAVKQILADTMVFLANYYPSLGITMDMVDELEDETLNTLADMLLVTLDLEAIRPAKRSIKVNVKKPDIKAAGKKGAFDEVFEDLFKKFDF